MRRKEPRPFGGGEEVQHRGSRLRQAWFSVISLSLRVWPANSHLQEDHAVAVLERRSGPGLGRGLLAPKRRWRPIGAHLCSHVPADAEQPSGFAAPVTLDRDKITHRRLDPHGLHPSLRPPAAPTPTATAPPLASTLVALSLATYWSLRLSRLQRLSTLAAKLLAKVYWAQVSGSTRMT